MPETVTALYLPMLLCPACEDPLHYDHCPADQPDRPILVVCTTVGCEHYGKRWEPHWPEIEMEEVEG